jgi:hypothetical protein
MHPCSDCDTGGVVFDGRELLYSAKRGKVTIRKKASPAFGAYSADRPVGAVGQFFDRGEARMRFPGPGHA